MEPDQNEEKLLRAVALQNSRAVLLARERAERALRESEERLRVTLASIGDAVIVCDAKGHVTYLNAVAENLTGWKQADAAGAPLDTVFRIINEQTRDTVENPCVRILCEGVVVGLANHTLLIARDGTERAIDDSAAPIRDADGKITGVVLIFRDVTARRQTDIAVARLAAIIESSDDAIISKDLNGTITSWNQGAERLFGYAAKEAVGQSIMMLIPAERRQEEAKIIERLKRGERVDHFETVRVHKHGSPLEVSLTISLVKDSTGAVIGASKIARDITQRKRTEAELQQAHELLGDKARHLDVLVQERTAKLQETIGELEAFSYTVSHDLRAPLRAMEAYARELLKESSLSAQGQTYLQRIARAATRLDRLTQEVLTYNKLSREEIQLAPVDLDKLAHEILQQYPEVSAYAKYIEVRSPLLPVTGNESLLAQILSNLLINACKFVAPGTKPRVRVWTEESFAEGNEANKERVKTPFVRLFVEDNGIGIAPEHRDRLFKIFGRIHPEEKYEGTGIGLAIVKKAVQKMGGAVDFESEPGKGSRFWVRLGKA